MNINKCIVDFAVAKKLKRIGFRDKCLYHYESGIIKPNAVNEEGNSPINTTSCEQTYNTNPSEASLCDAPTLFEASQWLYQNYNIFVIPTVVKDADGNCRFKPDLYIFQLDTNKEKHKVTQFSIPYKDMFTSPHEAFNKGLLLAFRHINSVRQGSATTPYAIRRKFINVRTPYRYFKTMGFEFKENESLYSNTLAFLKWVAEQDKWDELSDYLNGKEPLKPIEDE